MSKFHINKHGVPSPCKAKTGNCPLGGEESHFNTQEEAQVEANNRAQEEFGLLGQTFSNHDVDRFERLDNLVEHLGTEKVIEELSSALSNSELKEVNNHIIQMNDIEDYIDEDNDEYEKLEQIQRFLGAEETLSDMSKALTSNQLHENIDYIEDNWDINYEADNEDDFDDTEDIEVDYKEKLGNLASKINNQAEKLFKDVEQWLEDTEI